ncbi:ribonuclease D [Gemmatimonadota bacterium]
MVELHKPNSKPPQIVADAAALSELAERLAARSRIAIDTEAASFHRYVDRVYLVQVSSDNEVALIDPLAVEDLSPIGSLLSDPAIEVVFHDADYDLRILNRDYGFVARCVFDTRIAAQLAGEESVGLGALLDRYFQVAVNKKFQRADWSQRPLSPEMIAYAADDTRYLLPLRDRLSDRLTRMNRLDWAEEEFALLEDRRWTQSGGDEDTFLRIKGAKALPRRALAILRELHAWREATARKLDRAPFRILGNVALLNLARAAPRNLKRLEGTPGIPASAIKRYGPQLLEVVAAGLAIPGKGLPEVRRAMRPETDHAYDQRLERLKTLRNRRAKEVKMEPGLLCPNGTLQAVARAAPKVVAELKSVAEIRKWQRLVLGEAEIIARVLGHKDKPARHS